MAIDKQLLYSIILTRKLQLEPNAVVCRSEAGGGRCADVSCQDLHIEKGIEPTGEFFLVSGEVPIVQLKVGQSMIWLNTSRKSRQHSPRIDRASNWLSR